MKTIYYNKQTMKITQTQSEDTIPMTDELMADYRHYASNQQDKSLELVQEVGQVPYLVKYKLDKDGNKYSHYLDEVDEGGYKLPDSVTIEQIEQGRLAAEAKAEVKSAIARAIETMRVEVNGIGYDGDETSQTRMGRAIQVLVGDEPITWRMYDNSEVVITQTELGKAMRAAGIKQTELWYCSTVAEVEAIVAADTEWLTKYKGE
jgi:hypothetical protein